MIRRTVREWERIGYGADETEIPEPYADRLAARASIFSGPGGEGVLEHGRKGLRARGVVGVVAARDCQLEILPKIEGAGEAGVDDATLRNRLIHMLAVARDIRIDPGTAAQLAWQRDTILELLIRLFCNKLVDALRQGMPQQYTDREDDLPALRGRLDITRQFSVLAASPQMLACRFDERSPDMALNQVMKATTSKLSRLARAPDNQRALRELGFAYAANGGGSLAGFRDAAMIALASDALLRVSELLAVQVEDIQLEADGSGRLTVHHSKTDQESEGAVLYVGPPCAASWREAAGVHVGPLFRRIRRGDKVQAEAITDRAARDIIRRPAAEAGIEGRISGHSLRVGAAQSLAAAGAGLVSARTLSAAIGG